MEQYNLLKHLRKGDIDDLASISEEETKEMWKNYVSLFDKKLERRTEIAETRQRAVLTAKTNSSAEDSFDVGEKVLLMRVIRGRKTDPVNMGPFEIVRRKSKFYYIIKDINGGKNNSVHVSRLRKYHSDASEEQEKVARAADGEEYFVDKVLEHRGPSKKSIEFLVS
ncbi:hypothetical protein ADUPG1_008261 [Aduncisulcus paluster]|uniref:Uncharacterized protein n=1 Tax=Aduncisulcus paluster TaxID=2918883 RepID=A0ABQ5KSM3_9EUKA|nr:hypothetical protein ADUPG1_008261 [Aduncisulcus paluster]